MKIQIIGEDNTKEQTIERLMEDIPQSFCQEYFLHMCDSKKRYSIKQNNLCNYNDFIDPEKLYDGMLDEKGEFWLNVYTLCQKFEPLKEDEASLILVHQNYIDISFNGLFPYRLDGVEYTMNAGKKVGENYNGLCNSKNRWMILGIPNEPNNENTKIMLHEIAHLLLDPIYTERPTFEQQCKGKIVNHCENSVQGKRCIMNPPSPVTCKSIYSMHTYFCEGCICKLHQTNEIKKWSK